MSLGPIRPFACRVFVTSNFFLLARWFCLIFCIKKDIYNFTKVTDRRIFCKYFFAFIQLLRLTLKVKVFYFCMILEINKKKYWLVQ